MVPGYFLLGVMGPAGRVVRRVGASPILHLEDDSTAVYVPLVGRPGWEVEIEEVDPEGEPGAWGVAAMLVRWDDHLGGWDGVKSYHAADCDGEISSVIDFVVCNGLFVWGKPGFRDYLAEKSGY